MNQKALPFKKEVIRSLAVNSPSNIENVKLVHDKRGVDGVERPREIEHRIYFVLQLLDKIKRDRFGGILFAKSVLIFI